MKHKLTLGLIFIFLSLTFSQLVFSGESEKKFTYTGEPIKAFTLDNLLTETRYRTETYEDTCTRQVPYTENVCGNETLYRNVCETIPAHEECEIVTDEDCDTVTRYREECDNEPGRQVCTDEPDREECEMVNGRRICRRVPGGQDCHYEPGREICRNVPYTDTECRDVSRRVCERVPAHQECEQVSYQEYICRDVTKYKTETYACTQSRQVPYEVTLKTYKASISFNFAPYDQNLKTNFTIDLSNKGVLNVNIKDESDPSVFVQLEKKITQSEANNIVTIKAIYNVHFIDKSDYTDIFEGEFELSSFERDKVMFKVGEMNHPDKTSIALKIMQDEKVLMEKVLTPENSEIENIQGGSLIKINLLDLDIQKFWGRFSFDLKVSVTLPENIIDLDSNVLSKEQSLVKVIEPPYEILHRVIKLSNMKQLAKRSFLSDMTQYKNKIRSKTIGLFKDAGFNVDIRIETINYNKKDHSGSFELTLEKELSNEKIIEIFSKREVSVNI